jgi:NTE family protein
MLDDGPGRLISRGGDPLAPFAAQLQNADYRIGNLECPIATVGQPLDNKIFSFRADPAVLRVLRGRFDALAVANNHSGDYGQAAFLETLEHLAGQGIAAIGGGAPACRGASSRCGSNVAACASRSWPTTNSSRARSKRGADWPGIAWSEDSEVISDIRAARVAGADVVIPFMHWGWERERRASERQRQLAHLMIDAGADLVVGGHPHVTQDVEYYQGKLIVYSLGNFVFDGFDLPAARTGWLLRLTLDKSGLVAWDILAAQIDEEGTPHPPARHRDTLWPRRGQPGQGVCRALMSGATAARLAVPAVRTLPQGLGSCPCGRASARDGWCSRGVQALPWPAASVHNACMTIATIIHAGLRHSDRSTVALVLMGGGARTAYQVGVLRTVASLLQEQPGGSRRFPFRVLVGTSAGAINAAFLAARAMHGLQAFEELEEFWSRLRSTDVYRLNIPSWVRFNRWVAALSLSRHVRTHGAILDNMPLAGMLRQGIPAAGIEAALRSRTLDALAVSASSYTSGVHWTFCQTANRDAFQAWARPRAPRRIPADDGRALDGFQRDPVPVPVDCVARRWAAGILRRWLDASDRAVVAGDAPGRKENPGDRCRAAERPGMVAAALPADSRGPTLGSMAGHVMASVFHDTLQADVEQTKRVTETINQLANAASAMRYQAVDVLAIAPTDSLDALAQQYTNDLPPAVRQALAALGMLKGSGGALASYLLFEPAFVRSLIAMGASDAVARKEELLALLLDE